MIAISVFLAEHLSRIKLLGKETSRKIPHLMTGIVIAVVAAFVDLGVIQLLLVLDTIAILVVYRLNLFPSARAVDRLSWGELFFPLGLIVAASISPNKWVFMCSVLVLGIADALAALVGIKYGKHKYKIFGHTKSYEGSAIFLLSSFLIIGSIVFIAPAGLENSWWPVVWISFAATVIEGVTPWGTDNFLIPVAVAFALSLL